MAELVSIHWKGIAGEFVINTVLQSTSSVEVCAVQSGLVDTAISMTNPATRKPPRFLFPSKALRGFWFRAGIIIDYYTKIHLYECHQLS
ncbi:MAG: hypothetical protein ABR955_03250 [Verrucomicrobiota bacterium]